MHPSELLGQLVDLARDAGLEVRDIALGGAAEGDFPAASGTCRVQGKVWVLLAKGDSTEDRARVVARALKAHAGDFLESRYLPPAVRARLEDDEEPA